MRRNAGREGGMDAWMTMVCVEEGRGAFGNVGGDG